MRPNHNAIKLCIIINVSPKKQKKLNEIIDEFMGDV